MDLVEKAVNRLGCVAFLIGATVLFFHFLGPYIAPPQAVMRARQNPLVMPTVIALVAVSALVCAVAWGRRAPPLLILDLGLIYEAAGALGIAFLESSIPVHWADALRGVSWICLWVTIFPLAIPNTSGKTLLAALVSATMGPIGFAIQALVNRYTLPPSSMLLMLFLPNYVAAVWGILLGGFVYRLGTDAERAQQMGSYTLVEPIGKGGMGEVWRAKHWLLAREAAIKLIRPEMCAQNLDQANVILRRFQREAQATAALRSPHTIALYDFGIADDGSFYYVMELLDGLDLESLVRRFGPQSPARVIYLLQQACASLTEAHSHNFTHRDVKPKNTFLCRLGLSYDFVKLLDFGLVKVEPVTEQTRTQLSEDATATGTPAYMAPELALGKAVDGRTDLYALGGVAYWLLTGQLVFEAESAMAMAVAHVQAPPIPPSQRTELEIPQSLERVILSCLEKDPDDRPQSAWELSRQLAACNVGEFWNQEQAERWWRTHLPSPDTSPVPVEIDDEVTVK